MTDLKIEIFSLNLLPFIWDYFTIGESGEDKSKRCAFEFSGSTKSARKTLTFVAISLLFPQRTTTSPEPNPVWVL